MSKIKVYQCPRCRHEEVSYGGSTCRACRIAEAVMVRMVQVEREKKQVQADFRIVDYYTTASSISFILEDINGKRYPVFISDLFKHIEGLTLPLLLEEVKKGSAYGWKPL